MAPSKRIRLLAMIGRPKKVASKRTRTPTAPTPAPAPAPPRKPARVGEKQKGSGKIWHTKNEHAIIRAVGATRQGRGIDAIDSQSIPFEVRESKKTPKFRLQQDVHEELCRRDGYYLLKKGKEMLQVDAKKVTKMLNKGAWNKDRTYPYKFLHCRDLAFGKKQLGAGIMEDVQNHQINASEFYANYFATK